MRKIRNQLKKIFLYNTTKPVSTLFGFERGMPIDRYYIEKFLAKNQKLICGDVLEIAESTYTMKFGGQNVRKAWVLSFTDGEKVDILGDLATGEGISENLVDCFIMTQTLPFIYDINQVAKNAVRIVKPDGYLLVTVPGITQISRYDMDRWGHYWSFTDLSLRRLFEEVVPSENIKIETYGNVKTASCFLYGLAQHEISKKDLDYTDPDYQVIITAVVKKP